MSITPASKKKIKKVGILAKTAVMRKVKNLDDVVRLLKKQKVELLFDENIAKKVKEKTSYTRAQLLEKCDLVIVFGGDGTILKTAGFMGKKKVLVLGVNYGNIGFLSESYPENLLKNLKKIFNREFVVDERSLLRVTHYRGTQKTGTFLAMNDAVINQGMFARLIELEIEVDMSPMVSFKADGLIISTPTGSTAHSLSAGGPIVHPALGAIVLTPICPAPLTLRPIVIPNNRDLKIKIASKRKEKYNLGLTMDGQITVQLEYGDEIKVRRSSRSFHMIRFGEANHYKTLRDKLGWGKKPTP